MLRSLLICALSVLSYVGPVYAQAAADGASVLMWSTGARGSGVAFDPRNNVYLTVATYGTLRGRFISPDGVPRGGDFVIQGSGNYTHFPAVTYSPEADAGAGAFIVVWHESDQTNGGTSVHSRMVSVARGGPYGPDRQLVQASSFFEASLGVAYSTQSRTFLVVWGRQNNSAIGGIVVNGDGAGTSGELIVAPARGGGGVGKPGVAYDPTTNQFLVSFSGWDPNPFVKSVLVSASGVPSSETLLGRAGGTYQTDVTYNAQAGTFLIAWYQDPGPLTNGIIVSSTGSPIGSVIPLTTRYAARDSVDVEFNRATGTSLLVAQNPQTVENGGVEISGAGVPGLSTGFTALGGNGNYHPKAAAHTTQPQWMMVTANWRPNNYTALVAQRISTTSVGSGGTAPQPPPPPATCSITLSGSAEIFGPLGGVGGFPLTTGDSCAWTAGSNAVWLTLGSASISGTGGMRLSYTVAVNHSRDTRTGIIYVGNRSVTVTQAGRTWRTTDFNGDGLNDLIWQNRSTGELAVWRMKGINIVSGGSLSPANVGDNNWKIMGTLDANLDGQTDLLFQHDAGYVAVWRMSGETRLQGDMLSSSVVSDPHWRIVGTGDMDRDGFNDIIWQHADGRVAAWYMWADGLQVRDAAVIAWVSDPLSRVAGIEDFNRDGRLDILWRHASSGQMSIWHMDNRHYLSNATIDLVVSNMEWQIASTADFSGDGKPDFIWRNSSTGELQAWFMDGATFLNNWSLNPGRVADTNWYIVGPR